MTTEELLIFLNYHQAGKESDNERVLRVGMCQHWIDSSSTGAVPTWAGLMYESSGWASSATGGDLGSLALL